MSKNFKACIQIVLVISSRYKGLKVLIELHVYESHLSESMIPANEGVKYLQVVNILIYYLRGLGIHDVCNITT